MFEHKELDRNYDLSKRRCFEEFQDCEIHRDDISNNS